MVLVVCDFQQVSNSDTGYETGVLILNYRGELHSQQANEAAAFLEEKRKEIQNLCGWEGTDETLPFDGKAFEVTQLEQYKTEIKIGFEENFHSTSDGQKAIRIIMEMLAGKKLLPSDLSMTGWGYENYCQKLTLQTNGVERLVSSLGDMPSGLYETFFVASYDVEKGTISFACGEEPDNITPLMTEHDLKIRYLNDLDIAGLCDSYLVAAEANYAHPNFVYPKNVRG